MLKYLLFVFLIYQVHSNQFNFQSYEQQKTNFLTEQIKEFNDNQCEIYFNVDDKSNFNDGLDSSNQEDDIFKFSHSFLNVNDDILFDESFRLVSQNPPLIFNDLYSRYAFHLLSKASSTLNLSDNSNEYEEFFDLLGFGQTIDETCGTSISTQKTGCKTGQACIRTDRLQVEIKITNTKAKYKLDTIQQFDDLNFIPFSFIPIDDDSGVCSNPDDDCSDVCEDRVGFLPLRDASGFCSDQIPEISSIDIDTILNDNCDIILSDMNTGFLNEYNTFCSKIYCPPCNATGLSYHSRFGIGPNVYIHRIIDNGHIISDIDIKLTNLDTQEVKELLLTDITLGNTIISDDKTIRVNINDIFSNERNKALPQLQNNYIIVWGDNNLENFQNGITTETDNINKNPYDNLMFSSGTVPTQTHSIDPSFGWAYVNESTILFRYSNRNYYFPQRSLSSPNRYNRYGRLESCYNDFYVDNIDLPGWEINPDTGQPYIDSPCRITALLNQLHDDYLDAGVSNDDLIGYWYLPPNYNMNKPNYYLFNEYLVYDIQNDPNKFDFSDRQQNSIQTTSQQEINQELIEIYVDISTDFVTYRSLDVNLQFTDPSGCGFNVVSTNLTLFLEVRNPDLESTTYSLSYNCYSSNDTILSVIPDTTTIIQNVDIQPGEFQSYFFPFNIVNNTMNYEIDQIPDIICESEINDQNNNNNLNIDITLNCDNITPYISKFTFTEDQSNSDTCEWYDLDCSSPLLWTLVGLGGFFILFFVSSVVIMTLIYFLKK